jgi:hypothetical protein
MSTIELMIPELDDRGVDAGQQVQVRAESDRVVFQLFEGATFAVRQSDLKTVLKFYKDQGAFW